MLWNIDAFLNAHNALKSATSLDAIIQCISPIKEDLKLLLSYPPKNPTHRSTLSTKQITIDEKQLKLNDKFINDAAYVSDELNLDEIESAKLVYFSAGDSRRLRVPATESALTLFYARQLVIVDILRFLIEVLPLQNFDLVFPNNKSQFDHVFEAIKQVETKLDQLEEKQKATQIIGYSNSLQQISHQFLLKQHENLGLLLASYLTASASTTTKQNFLDFMEHLAKINDFNFSLVTYLPAVIGWASTDVGTDFTLHVFEYFKNAEWKLKVFKSSVSLVFMCFISMENRALPKNLSFDDLKAEVRRDIDFGGLECLTSLSFEISFVLGDAYFQQFVPLVQSRVPKLEVRPSVILEPLKNKLKLFVNEFVMSLADILKEMKQSEEDLHLALNLADKHNGPKLTPGTDLERFYLLVASLFKDEDCLEILKLESDFYEFLVWGQNCSIPFINAFYAEMLACLANGRAGAGVVHTLLSSQKRDNIVSYQSFVKLLDEFFRSVSMHQMPTATQPGQPDEFVQYTQPMEVTEETTLLLNGYLHLISKVSQYNSESKDILRGKESLKDVVPVLFKLLKLQQPVVSAVLTALSSLATPDMWPMLNSLLIGRFDMVLTSQSDILAFLELVSKLTPFEKEQDIQKFSLYLNFIFENVFTFTCENSKQQITLVQIQISCLSFLLKLLNLQNEAMLKLCFQPKVYRAIFSAFKTSFVELQNFVSVNPYLMAVQLSAEVCTKLLSINQDFGKPILYNLELVPQIALYSCSRYKPLSLTCLKLLKLLCFNNEFKPSISRQSRLLSILASSSQSSQIRIGFIGLLNDLETPNENKELLLSLLLTELNSSKSPREYVSLAHYLLGFKQNDLDLKLQVVLDDGVGGIKTGTSLLKAVCDMLVVNLQTRNTRLLKLTSSIIGYLAKDKLTSQLLLDYLRPENYFLNILKIEPLQAPNVDGVEDFYEHRAIMLEIWKREIQTCQKQLLLTVERNYLNSLVPIVFYLFDLEHVSLNSKIGLRCLTAWCDLVPVLVNTKSPITGVAFVARALELLVSKLYAFAHSNTDFALPVATLLSQLFSQFINAGVDNAMIESSYVLFESSLHSIPLSSMDESLRAVLYLLLVQYLEVVLLNRTTQLDLLMNLENAIEFSGDAVLQQLFEDVFNQNNKQLSTNALQCALSSLRLAKKLESQVLVDKFIRYNFIQSLVNEITPMLIKLKRDKNDEEDVQVNLKFLCLSLSLLMIVAQSRAGSLELVRASFVNEVLSLNQLPDDVLLLVAEILVTMLISLGPDYREFILPLKNLLQSHRNLILNTFNSENEQLNHCLTLLVSLVNE